jgi:hypothetical protein
MSTIVSCRSAKDLQAQIKQDALSSVGGRPDIAAEGEEYRVRSGEFPSSPEIDQSLGIVRLQGRMDLHQTLDGASAVVSHDQTDCPIVVALGQKSAADFSVHLEFADFHGKTSTGKKS